jgi:hypothetical protein
MVVGKREVVSSGWFEYLRNVNIVIKLSNWGLRLSKLFGFHIVEESLLIESFSEVYVWSLKVNFCLRTDEEVGFQVWRIKYLIENYRVFCIYAHFLRTTQNFTDIWFLNRFIVLGFITL